MSARSISGGVSIPPRSSSEAASSGDPPSSGGPVVRGKAAEGVLEGEVALLKGRTPQGVDVEINSVSAHLSWDGVDAQAAVAKGAKEFETGEVAHRTSVELYTGKVTVSTKGADGSVGRNVALGANVISAEHTATWKGSSLTLGAGVGVGLEASHGIRDFDKDGSPEFCGRIGVKFLTVGICIEDPFR